jgi:phytoene synthase
VSDPHAYCEARAAASGSSFYYSFRLLPLARRHAITALYALCREVDDIADECSDANLARIKLAWWRQEIDALYAGSPTHPVTQALAPGVKQFDLPRELLLEMLDGMDMDVSGTRYATFSELALYCHRVAGVVGELAARIFGHTQRRTLDYANRLGLAFQLTNIIRDVGEDARRGRIYLPLDELARFGVTPADLLHRRAPEGFRALMEHQYRRAQRSYDEALALLPREDRRAQRAGLAMAAIYRALLEEIRRDGYRVLEHRVALTPVRKLWLAWKTWMLAR